jgi:hypothetical protein
MIRPGKTLAIIRRGAMVTDKEYLEQLDKKLALMKIVQELEAERDSLKAQNAALKRQLELLEALERR